MKSTSKRIGGYLVALFLFCGIVAVANSTAQAQYPGYGRDRDYRRDRRDDRRDRRDDRRDRRDDRRDRRDDRYDDRYGRNGYYYGAQVARQQGYRDGLSTGAADAQRNQSFKPQRSHYWKSGTDGYRSSYGNKGQYKQIFRDAFVQGYREGYSRYARNDRRGNNGRWGNNDRRGNSRWPW